MESTNITETSTPINNPTPSTNEVVKCGNCNQIAPGVKNRSIWAQIIVWLLFIVFWPITVLYYIMNPKYRCSQCDSTFVGTKGDDGKYVGQKNGGIFFFILLGLLVAIAVIGILSSIVLASLSSARQKGLESRDKANSAIATTTQLYIEATVEDIKKTIKFPLVIDKNLTWIDISAKPKTIQLNYIIQDVEISKISNEGLKTNFLPDICKSEFKGILDVGVTIRDEFAVKNSSSTFAFEVTKEDCK